MIRTSNLVSKYKYICGFKKYTFQYPLTFADVSIFCKKLSIFCKRQYFYSNHEYESCVRDSLVLFSVFVRQKVTINENLSFTDYRSGLQLSNCSKLAINLKNDNNATNSDITPSSVFFDIAVFFFLKFNLVTGQSFTSIPLLVLELSQFSSLKCSPEIWKSEIPPSEFCPISGD